MTKIKGLIVFANWTKPDQAQIDIADFVRPGGHR